jgi:hypothetical protein
MMRFTVDRLLEPFSFAEFCDAYYEKKPLVITRSMAAYYGGLLTLDAVNAHLGEAHLLSTELRLVRNGDQLDEADYTWPDTSGNRNFADDAVDKEAVFARFYEGYTIGISSYERHSAAVLHLRHDLERVFHAPVVTSVFLAPKKARVSHGHRQQDDLFVLQFAGTKKWTVHNGSRKRVLTAKLEPGDLLYLPGGFVHEARSTDAVSGHITFTLQKYTYADLLRQIADNAEASPWLRRSLPVNVQSAALQGEFLRQAHHLFDHSDLPAYLERLHSDFAEDRLPDSTNRLADYVKLQSIATTSRFRRRTGLWPELTNGGGQAVLTFNRKSLEFPAAAAKSIRVMIKSDEFVVSALPGNRDENLALCSTLVREGFLTFV